MTRKSPREIERALQKVGEAAANPEESGVNIFTWASGTPSPAVETDHVPPELKADLREALARERESLEGPGGIEIITLEDAVDLYERIESALADSEVGDAIELDRYIEFLGGRARGEIPPETNGVREHFGASVTPEQVDGVWRRALEART